MLHSSITSPVLMSQRIHCFIAMQGSGIGDDRILCHGHPFPDLSGPDPIMLPYVDNLSIGGACQKSVKRAMMGAKLALEAAGFSVHEEEEPSLQTDSLGYSIDGEVGVVRPKKEKMQKTVLVRRYLCKRPLVSGRCIERFIGHLVHCFLVHRAFLSLLRPL